MNNWNYYNRKQGSSKEFHLKARELRRHVKIGRFVYKIKEVDKDGKIK